MVLGVVDLLIVIFLVLGAVIGFKNGAIKEGTKFIGFFLIVIISFLLKDQLMVLLYENLPFFNFLGRLQGITTLNILLYQLISFLIIFMALLFILRVLIVITGLIEWLLKMTVFLSLPSKMIGIVIGVIEYYVYIFIALYVLSIPILNLTMINESKFANTILEDTPFLSNTVNNTVSVYSEVWEVLKEKKDKKLNESQTNELVLVILLDNKLISVESAKELVESNKIIIDNNELLDNYSDDGTFYEILKLEYFNKK